MGDLGALGELTGVAAEANLREEAHRLFEDMALTLHPRHPLPRSDPAPPAARRLRSPPFVVVLPAKSLLLTASSPELY